MEEEDHDCLSAFICIGSARATALSLAHHTVFEMLRDRGYGVAVPDLEQSLVCRLSF